MKAKRLNNYLRHRKASGGATFRKDEVQENPDKHIDQDFPAYPHGPSAEETIKPKTGRQKKTAAIDIKDGEKNISKTTPENKDSEQFSEGSGGAFGATEEVRE